MLKLGGGPSFLTEFGVCSFNSENELNTNECEVILGGLEEKREQLLTIKHLVIIAINHLHQIK